MLTIRLNCCAGRPIARRTFRNRWATGKRTSRAAWWRLGYPYGDDIGALGAYPAGYDGPDIYHYDYIDSAPLLGEIPPPSQTLTVSFKELIPNRDGSLSESNRQVAFNISSRQLGLVKPANWTQPRRAPGEIQMARSDLLQTYGRFQKALVDYNNSIAAIEDFAAFIKVKSGYGPRTFGS